MGEINPSISDVLSSLGDNVTGIITEGGAATQIVPGTWVGSLTEITGDKGFWVILDDEDILLIIGTPIENNISYELHAGANLIGYPYRYETGISESISDEIDRKEVLVLTRLFIFDGYGCFIKQPNRVENVYKNAVNTLKRKTTFK